jgi:hypothetical protein
LGPSIKASIEFAREKEIEPMEHHLIPRAKGFHEITSSLKNSNVKAVYDCTFLTDGDFDVPVSHWLNGNPSHFTLCCHRIPLDQIPDDEQESKKYLMQLFKEKVRRYYS